jgi:hypothetical protein
MVARVDLVTVMVDTSRAKLRELVMPLKVIGTGFGRTGTDSLREALDILGFGPCHHMFEIFASAEQRRRWAAFGAGAPASWEYLYEGYTSAVDWPTAYYWPDLIEAYPEAKVVLTWRSAESWWTSFEKTILMGMRKPGEGPVTQLPAGSVWTKVFGGNATDRAHAIATYEANVAAVKARVRPERLLIHNLGDGWEPLCAHLGVAVPDRPYPGLNAADSFVAREREAHLRGAGNRGT